MGILTGLLLLPLAPLRGTIWIAERLAEYAERELDDEAALRRLLVEAEIALESGRLTEAEDGEAEDERSAESRPAHKGAGHDRLRDVTGEARRLLEELSGGEPESVSGLERGDGGGGGAPGGVGGPRVPGAEGVA